MNRLHVLAAVLTALTCSALEAQNQTMLTAKVPFDFQVGTTSMPAGNYRIQYSQHLIVMRSEAGSHSVIALTLPRDRSSKPKNWLLEFRCYGNDRFLAGIWAPNSAFGGGLPQSGREKEIARRVDRPSPTLVALAGK